MLKIDCRVLHSLFLLLFIFFLFSFFFLSKSHPVLLRVTFDSLSASVSKCWDYKPMPQFSCVLGKKCFQYLVVLGNLNCPVCVFPGEMRQDSILLACFGFLSKWLCELHLVTCCFLFSFIFNFCPLCSCFLTRRNCTLDTFFFRRELQYDWLYVQC